MRAAGPDGATVETLRAAARERRSVWIGFVDGHGVAGEQVLEPTSVGGGVVEGRDSVDGGLRRVPLHRITSIALVEETDAPPRGGRLRATGPGPTSGAASRARPARSGSASPTRGRGRRS